MSIVVGDLEADGLLDEATRVWCGVFIDLETGVRCEFRPDDILAMTQYLDTVDVLVMHNGIGYDWPLLKKLYNYDYPGIKVDTLLMSRLQNPERKTPFDCPNKKAGPHSIEAWGYRVGRGKPEHDDWSQFSEDMLHRCTEDTEILRMVYRELVAEGEGRWAAAHKLTHDLFEILHLQEQQGWLVDRPFMDKSLSMLDHWVDRIDKIVVPRLPLVLEIQEGKDKGEYKYIKKPRLRSGKPANYKFDGDRDLVWGPMSRIGFRPVNLNSNAEVKEWLLSEGWIPERWNYRKDKSGKYLYNDDGQRIKTSPKLNGDDPFIGVEGLIGKLIAKRVQCKHRYSLIEGLIKRIRPDGRISQGIAGITTTSRLTHRGIVNIPGGDSFFGKWTRKIFIAPPGYKIVGVDAAGCQNRMLAARVGNPEFTKILIEGDKTKGTSIHQVNMKAMATRGVEVKYGQSKNLNYAFMFGARDDKLGEIIGKGANIGAVIRDAMLSVAPGFESLLESLVTEWRSTAQKRKNPWGGIDYYNGTVTGLDGRPVLIELEYQVLVYVLQSDEAILMQTALVMLYRKLKAAGWVFGLDYAFVGNIHDEFQAEVRYDCIPLYRRLAEESITEAGEALAIACPQEGEAKVGNNWYETH